MDLINGKIYFVHTAYHEIWDKEYYDDLIPMVYTHNTHRMDDGIRYYFEDPIEGLVDSVSEFSLEKTVFLNEAKFFKYSLRESKRISTVIGPYLNNLIEKSKESNPEDWI